MEDDEEDEKDEEGEGAGGKREASKETELYEGGRNRASGRCVLKLFFACPCPCLVRGSLLLIHFGRMPGGGVDVGRSSTGTQDRNRSTRSQLWVKSLRGARTRVIDLNGLEVYY